MAYDTVRGWLGLDDDDETPTPAEPTPEGTDEAGGSGGDTAKTAAAHVEGGSTSGKAGDEDASSGGGASTSGAAKAATGSGGSLPASFPPAATGSGSGDGTDGGAGKASGTGSDDDTGGTGGADDEGSGDTGGEETGGAPTTPPAPSSADAECLEGTWVADDLDTFLRHKIRTHARGRKVQTRAHSGAYELVFTASGGGKGELVTTASTRVHHYEAELAKVPVAYTVRLTGTATSSYEVKSPGLLHVDAPSRGRIAGGLTVDIDGQKQAKRGVAMASDGDFEFSCVGDDLTLTPKSGKRLGKPLTFDRK